MKQSYNIFNQSVQRAIAILEHLAAVDGPQDLSTISRSLKMNKTTVFRFLSTLEEQRYVTKDENGKYTLGYKVTWLASKYLEKNEIRKVAHPFLCELSRQTGETVHLATLDIDAGKVIYIDKVDGNSAVLMASQIGGRMPIHSTALGKVLFSYRSEEEWEEYVRKYGLPPRAENTITDTEAFFKELRKVREQGYAIDNIENENGIRCVAAPIFNAAGVPVAALSISGWIITMTLERTLALVDPVKATADEISARLGRIAL